MATIVLQAAGAFLGGFLGPVGSAIGSAAGAMAGFMLDRSLVEGTRRLEGPRLNGMRPFTAEEGAPVPRIYGTVRVGGSLIWATRFEESKKTERTGGKGGPKVTTYGYSCSAAFALCEGPIAGVRRIWADGRELDLEQVTIRIHRGTEDQAADPLIEAKQGAGNAPAYRGLAYAVVDGLPLADYGNRIPQFQFEVMRPVGRLNEQVRSVVLLPGATEYGLLPRKVTRKPKPGTTLQVNRNVLHGATDLEASLDELQALCPNLEEVAVLVTWFGDDLRAGQCRVRPKVMYSDLDDYSEPWTVSGLARAEAQTVSFVDGAPAFGGTPCDSSVVECIAEIRSRGLKATLYPFMMMDIAPGNGLPDPYGGSGQPAFPWRGRITCHPAPGEPESSDKSAAARAQVEAFCGGAAPGDFSTGGGTVGFTGSDAEWGFRRLVLHYAHLAALAGGVDGFVIGSEMRGLTTLRDGAGAFPFVEALCELAGEARAILGAGPHITYGADWSEYFGYHPADGSGDVYFHLDPLWSHEAVTAVGIDNYMPLSDWRDADHDGSNPDMFREPYDPDGLRGQVAGGEGFDWYYPGSAARADRARAAIADGAYGKPWVFRYKDLVSWWENRHFDRPGGVEAGSPTGWVPRSKPFWFTELGCPAVDKGPNQPNVFPDMKSSENAIPHFSSGGRSDVAQSRFLLAHFDHWVPGSAHFLPARNPVSPAYGGRMVDPKRISLWAWDARPFPAYPLCGDLWRDGDNWHRGHWLNGRLSGVTAQDLIAAILADHGLEAGPIAVGGSMAGYMVEAPTTARAALEPLVTLLGISVRDDNGALGFSDEAAFAGPPVQLDELVVPDDGPTLELTRMPEGELPDGAELTFVDPMRDYQAAQARNALPGTPGARTRSLGFPGCLEDGAAAALLADWVQRRWVARDTVAFTLSASAVDVVPGAVVALAREPGEGTWLVSDVEIGLARRVTARRVARAAGTPWRADAKPPNKARPAIAGAPHVLLLDLPAMPGQGAAEDQFRVAAVADPWRSQAVYASPEETGFSHTQSVAGPATVGAVVETAGDGPEGLIDRTGSITVELHGGAVSSVSQTQLLNGANTAAIRSDDGVWEVVQFREAEEIEPSVWKLTGLLRAQLGTGDAMAAGHGPGAPFVLLDDAVVRAGLASGQAGLPLNWRIGPAGQVPDADDVAELTETGGLRARLPLAPVHLRLCRMPGGDAELTWIRRGRIDADSWLAEDIPLGEESERYRIEVAPEGEDAVRVAETAGPRWTWTAEQIATDLPSLPAQVEVTIRQISASVGAGLAARKTFAVV